MARSNCRHPVFHGDFRHLDRDTRWHGREAKSLAACVGVYLANRLAAYRDFSVGRNRKGQFIMEIIITGLIAFWAFAFVYMTVLGWVRAYQRGRDGEENE